MRRLSVLIGIAFVLSVSDAWPVAAQRSEEVVLERGDVQLTGTIELPNTPGQTAGVVLIQGSAAFDRTNLGLFDTLAHELAVAGVASLRMDDRGTGGSGGRKHELTAGELAEDIAAFHSYLMERPETDPERVGLLGHSFGGALAPVIAYETDAVAFVITLAGYAVTGEQLMMRARRFSEESHGADSSRVSRLLALQAMMFEAAKSDGPWDQVEREHRTLRWLEYQELEVAKRAEYGGFETYVAQSQDEAVLQLARTRWFPSFLALNPRLAISQLRIPFLALFGGADESVPPRLNASLMREALSDNPWASVHIVPDANHFFRVSGRTSEEMLSCVVYWLQNVAEQTEH